MRRSLIALSLHLLALPAAGLLLPAAATAEMPAGSGGAPVAPTAPEGAADGGTGVGEVTPPARSQRPRRRREPRRAGRPLLRSFALSRARFFAYGAPVSVSFLITDRSPSVRVKLVVRRAGARRPAAVIDLGERPTGVAQRTRLDGFVDGVALPQGALELRLAARDPGGRTLRAGARASASRPLQFLWHRFPLAGPFAYGGEDARFGAGRPGHSHQGQDLVAAEGTPVVAPRGGLVEHVAYQADGAGEYVVIDGEGEDRDYAFMHLQAGSIAVREGQRVRTGQLVARVGSTGASSGPHLHFEVWEGGGWYQGGHAVDPLRYLRRWDAWS